MEGRIVMLADQYDALRSRRVYKLPYDHETACAIITEGDGQTMPGHFDPELLRIFKRCTSHFDDIFSSFHAMNNADRSAAGSGGSATYRSVLLQLPPR